MNGCPHDLRYRLCRGLNSQKAALNLRPIENSCILNRLPCPADGSIRPEHSTAPTMRELTWRYALRYWAVLAFSFPQYCAIIASAGSLGGIERRQCVSQPQSRDGNSIGQLNENDYNLREVFFDNATIRGILETAHSRRGSDACLAIRRSAV